MTESGNLGFEGNEVFEISVCRVILRIYNTANPIRPKIFNISNFIFNNDVNNFLQNPTIEPCTLHKKMKFSIKDFFIKYDQIRKKLQIWSHLLKKPLTENFIFCAVVVVETFHS